jgi:VIT1/CCC1 family predicted Fe2+/Mn2+ transporter
MPSPRRDACDHRHRDVHGGRLRAGVFGVSDGLITNVSLILGVAGAHPGGTFVRLTGLAGLVAGSFSMAAGEYLSMHAQRDLMERELELERQALRKEPELERRELGAIYESRGVEPELAMELAGKMMQDPDTALETHAREELGIDPQNLGSPVQAALTSFAAFALGALLPLLPWFFASGNGAVLASVAIGIVASLTIGAAIGVFTSAPPMRTALRQLLLAAVAASVTYGIGRAVGATGT